jgi:hypothetical protein
MDAASPQFGLAGRINMICMCVFFRLSGVIPLTMRWLCSSRDQEDLLAIRRSGQKNIELLDTVVLGSHHNAPCRDSGSVEDNHDGDKTLRKSSLCTDR